MKFITGLLLVCIVLSGVYGLWYLGKKVNYALSYQSMVQAEIRAMVKPEALKEAK